MIRTITPASPAKYNDRYELKPWDLSEQLRTIEYLKADAFLTQSDDSFRALAYAEGEAYLRFPAALDADQWRWDRAYNLVRINDPDGIDIYIDLLSSAINSGQVRSADLPSWFGLYEQRLQLNFSSLSPQPGELGRGLIQMIADGSLYLWLVENPDSVDIYPLVNDIDFDHPHESVFLYDDLTGDSSPELVIYRQTSPGDTRYITPFIFDLSVSPPVLLPLQAQVPFDFGLEPRLEISVLPGSGAGNDLQVRHVLLPACPTYVTQKYKWNGNHFTISPMEFQLLPVSGFESYCEITMDAAAAGWGPDAALTVTTPLLDIWPPEVDTDGRPYPQDAYDQLRYRIGVLFALAGQPLEAARYMDQVINTPVILDSRWITPAREFQQSYLGPEDLLRACKLAQFCNLRDALRTLLGESDSVDTAQALAFLQDHGLTIRSSGVLDFDKDGLDERWMIIQPKPEAKLEFWILSKLPDGVQALFVQVFEASESLPYFHEPAGEIPVVQFELHRGFIFRRIEDTGEAYIEWVDVEYSRPTTIWDAYFQLNTSLLNGSDPAKVVKDLVSLLDSPRFKGDCIAFRICDQFHYTLGLAYDLSGEEGNAIDQYLWVWRNYGKSPYATLARLKLDYFPLPTYTRSPVPSATATRTRTPTPSSTATATSTTSP